MSFRRTAHTPDFRSDEGRITLVGALVALSFVSLLVAIGIPLYFAQKANVEDKVVQHDLSTLLKNMQVYLPITSENGIPAAIANEGWKPSPGNGEGYILNCSLINPGSSIYENSPKNYILWGYRKAQGSWDLVDFRAKEYVYDSRTNTWYTFGEVQNFSGCTFGPKQTYDMNEGTPTTG